MLPCYRWDTGYGPGRKKLQGGHFPKKCAPTSPENGTSPPAGASPHPFHTALEAHWLQRRRTAQPGFGALLSLASAYDPQGGANPSPTLSTSPNSGWVQTTLRPVQRREVRAVWDWNPEQCLAAIPPRLRLGLAPRLCGKTLRKLSRGTSIKPRISDRPFGV
jgi:hypothetical protein